MSYGQGVGIAFWMALVSVVINFVVTYVYVSFIDTGAMDLFYERRRTDGGERFTDDQIEMA